MSKQRRIRKQKTIMYTQEANQNITTARLYPVSHITSLSLCISDQHVNVQTQSDTISLTNLQSPNARVLDVALISTLLEVMIRVQID